MPLMVTFTSSCLLLTTIRTCILQIVHVQYTYSSLLDINYTQATLYLDCSVQRSTSKLVVILGVDDNLHHIMGVALKHLRALPLFIPVP